MHLNRHLPQGELTDDMLLSVAEVQQALAQPGVFVSMVDMHRKAIEAPGVVIGHKVEDPSQLDFASMRLTRSAFYDRVLDIPRKEPGYYELTAPRCVSRRHRTVGCRRLLSRLLFIYSSEQTIASIVRVFGRV